MRVSGWNMTLGRGVRVRKKTKQAEQELRFDEVLSNIALHVY